MAKVTAEAKPPSLYAEKTARLAELKQERQSWDSHYKDLQDFFLPRRGRFNLTDANKGNKRNQKLVDPSPKLAARVLAAGMHAGSTNPATPWFRLETPDPEMMEFRPVADWLWDVETRMRAVFNRSNLYAVLPLIYGEAGIFGTAPVLMQEDPVTTVHFVPKTVGSYSLAVDPKFTVDTLYCEYRMTVRQVMTLFPQGASPQVKAQFAARQFNQWVDILHAIEPNAHRQHGRVDAANMPWSSCYFETGRNTDSGPLRLSGFEDNPLACFTWERTGEDVYGSSPGMDALGCSAALQVQTKRKAQGIDKSVDPPMVGDPNHQNSPSTVLPGGVTWAGFTASGSAPKFQPAYVVKPDIQWMLEDIRDVRDLVERCLYNDLFLAITRADPRNAREVEIIARKEEQLLMLGPVLQNKDDGLIKPIIDRTFYVMMRQGMLPPPPQELDNVDLKVEMMGLLAQAQRMIATGSIERFTGFVASVAKGQADAGVHPDVLDKVDVDQAVDEYGQALGVPPSVVRSDDQVAAIRASRAQEKQAAQLAAAAQPAKDAAAAAKSLSETKLKQGSALDAMLGAA